MFLSFVTNGLGHVNRDNEAIDRRFYDEVACFREMELLILGFFRNVNVGSTLR